jgi:very-short-patch-repair endonuclease
MWDKERTEHRLAVLATRQHGVVSVAQLVALGYSTSAISRAAARGRLHSVHRRVYAVGHRDLSWEGRCLGAVLACAPAVASHRTAAWVWDILRTRPQSFQLTATSRRRAKYGFEVHYADLAATDRGLRDGIPVTSLPRTLLDLAAAELRPERLDSALQRAEERKLLDLRPLDELLGRVPHHPGATALRRALDIYRPRTSFTRSDLEREFLRLVLDAGLARPRTNFVVGPYELDAYWPERRFAVELEVYETHGSRHSFETDKVRREDLLLLGIELIQITGPRLDREPEVVIARVAQLLAERTPAPAPLD